MAKFLTNVMISEEPYFAQFDCFKAPLLIEEREAWRRRHQHIQPMAPSENYLFFVSQKDLPSFVNENLIDRVALHASLKEHSRILRFLVHQALKILFESRGFSKWRRLYSKKNYMSPIRGRFGLSYNVFSGVQPNVSFEDGHCMIAFPYSSKIFTRLRLIKDPDVFQKLLLITLCEDCLESTTCKNIQHKISRLLRLVGSRVFLRDIEGKEFDCPLSNVRIESNPRIMKGEYTRILRQTAPSTFEEHQFLSNLVSSLSGRDLVLDLGRDITFSWLELEAQS